MAQKSTPRKKPGPKPKSSSADSKRQLTPKPPTAPSKRKPAAAKKPTDKQIAQRLLDTLSVGSIVEQFKKYEDGHFTVLDQELRKYTFSAKSVEDLL
jgi:hypothetical protein